MTPDQTTPPQETALSAPWLRRPSLSSVLAALAVVVVTLAVFRSALAGGFLNWDDPLYVTKNPALSELGPLELVRWSFGFHAANWHPLVWWVHASVVRGWGLDPHAHHFVSWLLHALSAVLVFAITKRFLERRAETGRGDRALLAGSIAAALVFAIHPLRVESVAWVAETKDVLVGFFYLLAVCLHMPATTPDGGTARAPAWMVWTAGGLALLSKPMAVSLPVVLLLVDIHLERGPVSPRLVLERARRMLPLWLGAAAVGLLEVVAARGYLVSSGSLPLGSRLLIAFRSPAQYLFDFCWPGKLSPLVPLSVGSAFDGRAAISLTLVVVATVFAFRRPRSGPATAWWIFLVVLAPVLGALQVGFHFTADRFTYLAQIPWAIAVGWVVLKIVRTLLGDAPGALVFSGGARAASAAVLLLLGAWVAHLAYLTARYIPVYADSFAHWHRVLELHPESAVAWSYLGLAQQDERKLGEAIASQEKASRLDPADGNIAARLANARELAGDRRGALADAERAVQLAPRSTLARSTRGGLRLASGNPTGALEDLEIALSADPDMLTALVARGRARADLGDLAGGLADLDRAARLAPEDESIAVNRAGVLGNSGRREEARAALEKVVARNPKNVEALYSLGILAAMEQRWDEADRALAKAIEAAPGAFPILWTAYQVAKARGAKDEAIARLDRILALHPGDPQLLAEREQWKTVK